MRYLLVCGIVILLGACASAPNLTLDKDLMHTLPEGAGWAWLTKQAPAPMVHQCVFAEDGETISIKYAKEYDYSVMADFPSSRILKSGPKSRYELRYLGLIGGVGLLLQDKESDSFPHACFLAWYPSGSDPTEMPTSASRYIVAARNAGISLSCRGIDNCQ